MLLLAFSDIKVAHSVFALPFAALGGALSVGPTPQVPARLGGMFTLVIACMFFARTWAMLVNRLADWRFDRDNPRTARRVVASGRLSPAQGWAVALGCAAAFVLATLGFLALFSNPWPALLSLPVLAWIAAYSYTKRFTALCHVFLGGALAASPIAAAIAVRPEVLATPLLAPASAILLLAAFVLLWVAGFDIAYALQDIDFDRRAGLHSIPARLGVRGALWVSRLMHAAALVSLAMAARAEPRFGIIFDTAVVGVGLLLLVEHAVLIRRGVAGLPLAFFTINGIVSLTLGAAGVLDLLL
jgi:4-hydroxybenzoate polyprenyltransferase